MEVGLNGWQQTREMVAYPTAPVPSVISKMFAPLSDRKSLNTLMRSPEGSEPSIVLCWMPWVVKIWLTRLSVFFHEEKTILG